MSEPILCHECGHDIDIHDWENGCPDCELGSLISSRCILKPSDIARALWNREVRLAQVAIAEVQRVHALLTAEPTEAEVERAAEALARAALRAARGLS